MAAPNPPTLDDVFKALDKLRASVLVSAKARSHEAADKQAFLDVLAAYEGQPADGGATSAEVDEMVAQLKLRVDKLKPLTGPPPAGSPAS